MNRNSSDNKTRKITTLAMLAAIGIVLVVLFHPKLPPAGFIEYDMADVPIYIGTFLYGPAAGIALTLVVSVIQGITVSLDTAPFGILMHILATGGYVLIAGPLYRRNHTRRGAILCLAAGTLFMTVIMMIWNLAADPPLYGIPFDTVVGLMPYILICNLLKAGINSVITYVVYKPISRFVSRESGTVHI